MAGSPLPGSLPHGSDQPPGLYAWSVFALLCLLGLLDFGVRQLLVGIFPLVKAEWHLSFEAQGKLAAIVPLMVGLSMLPMALLIDRWSRVKAIFLMALVWSLATIGCGIAANYNQMMVARGLMGLGEAAYGPAGFALLAWYFPLRLRATVLGGVMAAGSFGNVAGIALGGVLAQRIGWHQTFIYVGLFSLAVTFLVLLVRDYPTQPRPARQGAATGAMQVVKALVLSPTAFFAYMGGASFLFVLSTLVSFLPTFMGSAYHLPVDQAAIRAAAAVLCGAIGAVLWAQVADRWGTRNANGRLYVPMIAALACAALFGTAFLLLPPGPLQFGLLMAGAFLMTAHLGAVNTVVMDVVEPGLRASSAAMVGVAQNLLGIAAGPFVVGVISDRWGLEAALGVLPAFALIAALCFWISSRYYPDERAALNPAPPQ